MLIDSSPDLNIDTTNSEPHDSKESSRRGCLMPLKQSKDHTSPVSILGAMSLCNTVCNATVVEERNNTCSRHNQRRRKWGKGNQQKQVNRRRYLRMLQLTFVLVAIFSVLWPPVGVLAVPATKWLQHRLRQIAAAHLETPSVPLVLPPTAAPTSIAKAHALGSEDGDTASLSSRPLLVVSTNDGRVWTIDAADGSLVAGFSTGPPLLVIDDHFKQESSNDFDDDTDFNVEDDVYVNEETPHLPPISARLTESRIVPSIDGMLYWRQPILSSTSATDDDSNSGDDSTKLVPIASIRDLVDNPIQLCQEVAGENCDILTATSLGPSLFSLNSQGSLNWARARSSASTSFEKNQATVTTVNPIPLQRESSSSSNADDDSDTDGENADNTSTKSGPKTSLLLQRQDYLVEQISTKTGEQVWNMTWGSLEALDFEGGAADVNTRRRRQHGESFHYLPSGRDSENTPSSSLPSLMFSNQGKGLVALWTQPPKFLWKQGFTETVTNVHGIEHDMWQAVNVVAEEDGYDHHDGDWGLSSSSSPSPKLHPRLTEKSDGKVEPEDIDRWYKWWATGGKQTIQMDGTKGNEGMLFVPGPNEHGFVRNSMYMNQLRDAPLENGAQHIQGYLAAHPHNSKKGQENTNLDERPRLPLKPDFYEYYDPANMPRLLLLPSTDQPSTGSSTNKGGVFVSWSLVVTISTLLVGSVGAAYILYGQKKRKWLSTPSNDQDAGVNKGSSFSRSRAPSISQDGTLGGSDSNLGEQLAFSKNPLSKKLPRHTLNRSCSAPIIGGEHDDRRENYSGENLPSSTISSEEESPNRRSSTPAEVNKETGISPSALVKHQSAPVESPITLQQGGVGMIDGIPLIRYSRYQSEFKELQPLGRGGFGSVFRVSNVLDSREYAVKKVSIRSSDLHSPGTEAFSQELHRVLREVKFLALLDHPNIVRYYTAWLEMEGNDQDVGIKDDVNSKALSRRFSSGLLTSLDPTFGGDAESKTTQSLLGDGQSVSRATPSYLKGGNATNPLGWNNDFRNFEESSASAYRPKHTMPVLPSMEDCGFIFEEGSNEEEEDKGIIATSGKNWNRPKSYHDRSHASSEDSYSESHSLSSSWDASYSLNRRKQKTSAANKTGKSVSKTEDYSIDQKESKSSRHTLYIQMQLCSAKTLGDFLANKEARKGPTFANSASSPGGSLVDIPWALRHFLQIVRAVQHVHQQGLIHRDLKPSNCFIDESGVVKVGDFGLSRESNDSTEENAISADIIDGDQEDDCADDNTIGVGTRSYASPEQMVGSDYDSKTDIYALGIMLFELLYPMYTGMERHICFQQVRSSCTFPEPWNRTVKLPFPTLDELVRSMLSLEPKSRPSADKIARHIQGLLDEHSVTLNVAHRDDDQDHNIIFVRVEAKPLPDILKSTIQFIHDASSPQSVDIVQYGMRSSTKNTGKSVTKPQPKPEKRAILEFALSSEDVDSTMLASWATGLVSKLEEHDEIIVARHVWHQMQNTP